MYKNRTDATVEVASAKVQKMLPEPVAVFHTTRPPVTVVSNAVVPLDTSRLGTSPVGAKHETRPIDMSCVSQAGSAVLPPLMSVGHPIGTVDVSSTPVDDNVSSVVCRSPNWIAGHGGVRQREGHREKK